MKASVALMRFPFMPVMFYNTKLRRINKVFEPALIYTFAPKRLYNTEYLEVDELYHDL
jgi:hypothetical protein